MNLKNILQHKTMLPSRLKNTTHYRENNMYEQMNREIEFLNLQLRKARNLPRIDLRESDTHYTAFVELPEVTNVNVQVKDNQRNLFIEAERSSESRDQSGQMVFKEIRYGYISRTLRLKKNILPNTLDYSVHNGILTIKIQKDPTVDQLSEKIDAMKMN